jgi:hypothetical protein
MCLPGTASVSPLCSSPLAASVACVPCCRLFCTAAAAADVTTLQVAAVVVATVVGSTLLVGADVNSGSNEGLEAFVASLAASAAAGATAAQVRACRAGQCYARHQGAGGTIQAAPKVHLRPSPPPAASACLPCGAPCLPPPAAPAHRGCHAGVLN